MNERLNKRIIERMGYDHNEPKVRAISSHFAHQAQLLPLRAHPLISVLHQYLSHRYLPLSPSMRLQKDPLRAREHHS